MDACEECGQERIGVLQRGNGKGLCSDCNMRRVREMSPTGLVMQRPGTDDDDERTARDLFQYYLDCGIGPGDALEKLAFVLAMDPPMFTRLVPVLDELREYVQKSN